MVSPTRPYPIAARKLPRSASSFWSSSEALNRSKASKAHSAALTPSARSSLTQTETQARRSSSSWECPFGKTSSPAMVDRKLSAAQRETRQIRGGGVGQLSEPCSVVEGGEQLMRRMAATSTARNSPLTLSVARVFEVYVACKPPARAH